MTDRAYKLLGISPDADDAAVAQAYQTAWKSAQGNAAYQLILEQAFVSVMARRGWNIRPGGQMEPFAPGEEEAPLPQPAGMPRRRDYPRFYEWLAAMRLWKRDRALTEAALHPFTITGRRVSYFAVNLQLCLAAAAAVFFSVVFDLKGSTGAALFLAVLGVWAGSFAAMALLVKMLRSMGGILIAVAAGFLLWRYGALLGRSWWPWAFWITAGIGLLIMLAAVLPAVTVQTHKASQTRWVLLASTALAVLAPLILLFG